jgi:hypothetical protein
MGERGINALRRHALVARNGTLPLDRLRRWFHFDWRVTNARAAWLAENITIL